MKHRHLNSDESYSSAAIDDIIGRGGREDWTKLDAAAKRDPKILERILKVCAPRLADPGEQRYHLWSYHARHTLA